MAANVDKWIEVNIHLEHGCRMDQILLGPIKNIINEIVKEYDVKSWHYLRESCPLLRVPEIRLRFYASAEKMPDIKKALEGLLTDVSIPEPHFGAHGKPGEEYKGEVDGFKERGWPIMMKLLQNGSETALEFLRGEPRGNSEKPWEFYVIRGMHLILNQIGIQETIVPLTNGKWYVGIEASGEMIRECYPGNFPSS